jgi:hypothetical protein
MILLLYSFLSRIVFLLNSARLLKMIGGFYRLGKLGQCHIPEASTIGFPGLGAMGILV